MQAPTRESIEQMIKNRMESMNEFSQFFVKPIEATELEAAKQLLDEALTRIYCMENDL